MKKFLSLICVLACVLGLTACGGGEQYSEYQKEKNKDAAEYCLRAYIPSLMKFMDDARMEAYSEYTMEEIKYLYEQEGLDVDGYGLISAAQSFNLNGKTTGSLTVKPDEAPEVIVDGEQIIVHVNAQGEKKDAQIEVILSNDRFLRLKGGALNPNATFSELMGRAALNTVIGMGTVFAVLILISLIIAAFGLIPRIQESFSGKKKEEPAAGVDKAVAQITRQEESLEEADDLELAAVIAAAIAAYEGAADASGYVVRSIRKINR